MNERRGFPPQFTPLQKRKGDLKNINEMPHLDKYLLSFIKIIVIRRRTISIIIYIITIMAFKDTVNNVAARN